MQLQDDIETTSAWTRLLFEECLASEYYLHKVQVDSITLPFLSPRPSKLLQQLISVRNYYTTLARPDQSASQPQYCQLLEKMMKQPWHMAEWGPLDIDEPFALALLGYLKKCQLPALIEPVFINWQLRPSGTIEDYFEQLPSKLKSTLKRKKKKLEKEAKAWRFQLVSTPEEFKQHFVEYERIYKASWKPEEEHIGFIRKFCAVAAENGWLRLGILKIDEKAVATQIWFVYNGKASIFKLAYLPEFKRYSPGTLLTESLMRHVLERDKVHLVDFGMGDEPYKADWMNYKNTRYTIASFNTRSISGKLAQLRYQWLPAVKRKLLNHD